MVHFLGWGAGKKTEVRIAGSPCSSYDVYTLFIVLIDSPVQILFFFKSTKCPYFSVSEMFFILGFDKLACVWCWYIRIEVWCSQEHMAWKLKGHWLKESSNMAFFYFVSMVICWSWKDFFLMLPGFRCSKYR